MNQEEMIRDVRKRLFEMQDTGYQDFHARLGSDCGERKRSSVSGHRYSGNLQENFGKTEGSELFLKVLPHQYYEENNLHGLLIEQIRDYDKCLGRTGAFSPVY